MTERRWRNESFQNHPNDTVRFAVRYKSFFGSVALALRTQREYYARYHTYRILPSELMAYADSGNDRLLAADRAENIRAQKTDA